MTTMRITGELNSSTDLFDRTTVVRMLGHFQALLAGIVADVTEHIAALPLLTGAERQQLLVEWNATNRGVWGQGSGVRSEQSEHLSSDSWYIHHLFAAQAARTPDAIALVFDRPTMENQEPRTKNQEPGMDDDRIT